MANLLLQLLIHLENYLLYIFVVISTLFFFLKAYRYEYRDAFFWLEIIGMWVLTALQFFRLFVGSKGNKTERSSLLVLFIFMLVGCAAGLLYFLFWQSYVIVFEFAFGIVILTVEFL